MRNSTILLAAAMLLAPAPLAAQKVEITRATATPENILKALAEGEAVGNAGSYAANILIQTSSPWIKPREHRERRGAGLARRDEGPIAALLG